MAAVPRPASVLPPGVPPARAPSRAARRRSQLALCFRLAARGPLAWLSIAIAVLTLLGAIVVSLAVARRGAHAPLANVPDVASSAFAWGAGVLLAFAAAAHAFRRDRSEGIFDLLVARGGSTRAYAWARVGGLVILLAIVIAGGSAVTGIVATLAAARAGLAASTLQATFASVLYGLAFAVVLAPIALATLGARSRAGGYLWLLVVLVLPELFERWSARVLPDAWRELVSVPAALAALKSSLMPPGIDLARAIRASVVLTIVTVIAMLVVRREITRAGEKRPGA